MHKIYENKGSFVFIYQIPQIIYSILIARIFIIPKTALLLSEKSILSIKNENKAKIYAIKRLIMKFILFFALIYILLILFWHYLSCFWAIYINTKIHIIKDSLISYSLYLLYPFGLCLIPGSFRIPSLATKKQDKEC